MKNKLLVLLVAIITGFGIVRAESIDLLDSTVTVNESSAFGHSKTVYQYNSKGSLIRQTRIYATWSKWKVGVPMIMNRRAVFVYDDEGHEIDLYYSSLDTATGKWTDDHRYLYDEWHNRTYSVGKWNADSTALLSGVRYFYDSNHFLIGNESFDTWNGVEVVTDKYFYTNDANGYKISMYGQFRPDSAYDGDYKSDPEKFNQSGWKNVDSAYYERNAAGQSIRETFFRWDESNNQWLKDGYQDFTYDAQGHLLTDTVFARDFETNIITYNNMSVREYDSYGNLTRTTTYSPVVSEGETQWQVNDVSVNEYTYNEKGLISLKRSHTDYNDGAEPNYSTTTYYYSHYDLDENGNIVPEPCLIASGTCGDNLTWELSCDSVLTISGSGAMTSAPWIKSYKTAIKNAIIEDGVTNIYGYAFYYCSNLESVTIGNGVTQIEEYAFYKCTALESVQLPKNIQSIGNYAYAYCGSLTSIALPNSVTAMGDEVFCMCTSLASASLSENLTKISMGTFDGCTALSSIIVPEGVQTIEARAFYQCKSLVSIELPSTVTFIDGVAFSLPISFETALKTFTCHAIVPPSLGNNVFEYLEPGANLIRLYVPGASIEAYKAADQWKEFEIILPIPGTEPCESDNTIRTISACSGYWFNDEWLEQSGIYHDTLLNHLGCDSIIELHLTIHSSYGGGWPSDLMDTITIERGESVIISNGVTIYPTETGYQNDTMRTIYGCDSIVTHYIIVTEPTCLLASGTCGDNLTWELSCDSVLTISGTGAMTNYHTALNRSPWDGDAKIKEVIFSDGVTTVGDYAFYDCDKLTSVTLPNSITYIGVVAFEYCGNLTEIEIPNSVTTISSNALAGCGFSTIFIPSSVTTIGGAALDGNKLQSINVAEDNPNYCSVDGVLFDKNKTILIKYPDGKQGACIIPSTVTSIGYLGLASGISSITCEALVPPSLEKGALVNVDKAIPLYVHYESIEVYKATAGWKDFTNIQPIEGTFPVTFLDYNGEVLSEQNVAYNQAAAAPEVPAREGYTFSGWSTDIEHIVARTFAIALYDKIGGTLTYLSEEGDVIATENVDLHLPAAPIIAGKSFKGWLTESADSENGIVLRATYTFDNPTTHDDVTITPSSNSAYVIFPFITGALTYQLVIRDLFGNVVCKIMFSATGHLLGIAFAPSRNRESQQATQTTGFNFTVEGLDANTTYEYEFVANDDTDEVIETLSGSFTTTVEVPTDNEQVNSPSAVRKYLDDGHLMIDANSHIFNTQGKMIK